MKDDSKRYILIVLISLLLSSCGDDIPFSYDCSVFPDQSTSEYILPYEIGSSFTAFPHAAQTTSPERSVGFYGIDIRMPIGTPLVASRPGTVVRIEERFVDGDLQVGHENFIIIKHDDGTFSRYFHLTNEGAIVNVGDLVMQLDRIAFSGNSGKSTAPHLHFDVTDEFCDPDSDINNELRRCQTLPVTFRNTRALDCGLEWNETYMALSF